MHCFMYIYRCNVMVVHVTYVLELPLKTQKTYVALCLNSSASVE